MADSVNMSLDDIIKQNQQKRVSRTRGRGGGTVRGRGNRGGRGAGRGRPQSRQGTPNGGRGRSRSRSQVSRRNQSQNRSRSQQRSRSNQRSRSQQRTRSQNRSFSQQRRYSNTRPRSASRTRSHVRGLTPKGRAGLEDTYSDMPALTRRFRGRGGQMRFQRSNSIYRSRGGVHSRLGVSTRSNINTVKPLAVAKRGILKRGRGLTTRNRYSNVGLRSDQILQEQRHSIRNNVIRSQTFTRSRNNSISSASQLTVSVANDFAKRRRNSIGNAGFLNKKSLAQLDNQYGGYNTRRGPGSVKSVGSNRSNQSNSSRRSMNRGRGRGRGGNQRGVGGKFLNKHILNPKLQKEIAAIQGKTLGDSATAAPGGINFTPTPAATTQTLHQRFATA